MTITPGILHQPGQEIGHFPAEVLEHQSYQYNSTASIMNKCNCPAINVQVKLGRPFKILLTNLLAFLGDLIVPK